MGFIAIGPLLMYGRFLSIVVGLPNRFLIQTAQVFHPKMVRRFRP